MLLKYSTIFHFDPKALFDFPETGAKGQLNASSSSGYILMLVKIKNNSWEIKIWEINLIQNLLHELLCWQLCFIFLQLVLDGIFPRGSQQQKTAQHS